MEAWKNEVLELLRLNRPIPPVINPSSMHEQAQTQQPSPGEGTSRLGRRPGKEPAGDNQEDVQEISGDNEDQGENVFEFQRDLRAAEGGHWAPRRENLYGRNWHHNHGGDPLMRYKQEFPPFVYEHPRLWVVRCGRFFMLARIPRDEVMNILCVNLSGKVGLWFEGHLNELRVGFQWVDFARAMCKRFCEHNIDVMEEFSNLKQWGNVVDFADKYEEYKGLCKSPTFNIIEGADSQDNEGEISEDLTEETEATENPEQNVEVTLNAVIGGEGMNTIKLLGAINRQPITILVDCGSTHSFIDPRILVQLRITPEKARGLIVTVANGEIMSCDSVCCGLKWQVQDETFERDLIVLRLGGCDMVLGMDWIDSYSPIQLHTRPPGISFYKDGKRVLLKGMTKGITLKQATKKEVRRWKKEGVQGYLLQGMIHSVLSSGKTDIDYPELSEILGEFQDVFEEPKTLPPKRLFYHEIPLIPGAKPVNIKPYRYSFLQKNTIEKMVDEMLTAGIIVHINSPFAFLVLLVPKKDNSWRFFIDYRALNDITIKNKFPTPIVEDLFSELANAKVFTKLDFRAGYHQVRMREGEEYKTTFRTHQGLYEFRVMPFGLTNASATFQALMNHVFKPLIRKTVLVFFDDILIYSPTLKSHWEHLREVLRIMRGHKLLAKLNKCSFANKEVEYHGHIISERGLHTDPSKLAVVSSCPKPTNVKELRGFLGLKGYYRRFIRSYGVISIPLTNMLKKDAFQWSLESESAFETLKQVLPDFDKEFVVEADACHKGMGAVLMQEGKPMAYFSKGFGTKHLGLSIYEKGVSFYYQCSG
ncbi:PREDICTED: uncharacterized protein LOC109159525 [Ipomoea nil]|uniref:uncharacterized protein LOC109159525 n=1 Tax=Ipomoea nil TaxID=35883 RepID=UPI0009009627|nr:PREDICTED: uncharacterized protein LOC109159525 [Ipomoea nil]